MADYGADPVWMDDGEANLDMLAISERLREGLRAWARRHDELLGPQFEVRERGRYRQWVAEGRRHARDLQAELGAEYQVTYWHEREERASHVLRGRLTRLIQGRGHPAAPS